MIYLKYDLTTGDGLGLRKQSAKDAPPVSDEVGFLPIDEELYPAEWRVNLDTMQLEPRTKSHEELDTENMVTLRGLRNQKLAACDWRVMPDSPISDEQRALWVAYRTALRELPQTIERPLLSLEEVPWPEEPVS